MQGKKMNRWLRAIRAPGFLTASVTPVLLGTAMAWHDGAFSPLFFGLTLLGAIAVHCGANSCNECFDFLSGNDVFNTARTPFSGGSGVLVEKELPVRSVYQLSLGLFGLAGLIGTYFTIVRGTTILVLGVTGMLIAYYYTAPPFRLVYRGLGELAVGLCFGPLLVAGTYFLQTRTLDWVVVIASLPIGLLTAAILYINAFPDYEADRRAAKRTLVVRLGPAKAVWGFYALLVVTYLVIVLSVLAGVIPDWSLLSLLTIPVAVQASIVLGKYHSNHRRLLFSSGATIMTHFLTGLLLTFTWIIHGAL